MRKSLGSKRNFMDESDIQTITQCFGKFEEVSLRPDEKAFACKIFPTHAFGYRRVTIERPLRESYQFSDERIATLRYDSGALNGVMQWTYETFGELWSEAPDCPLYGDLSAHETEIRAKIKADFSELKEKQIKDLLDRQTWLDYKALMLKARAIQASLGSAQHDDMNQFEDDLKSTGIKLDNKEKKAITAAVSWKNPDAQKVIKKVHKGKANPLYGLFEVKGQVLEYASDSDLRDSENVPLDPRQSVNELIEGYIKAEVLPHVPEAWIDGSKKDAKDDHVGIVGYEIPFNRHFYVYTPPRPLEEIDADLDRVSAEIMALLQAVHS
jgi:type I restriction enzyme M protein